MAEHNHLRILTKCNHTIRNQIWKKWKKIVPITILVFSLHMLTQIIRDHTFSHLIPGHSGSSGNYKQFAEIYGSNLELPPNLKW